MDDLAFFNDPNFKFLPISDSLPFPLNQSFIFQSCIFSFLLLNLFSGLKIRIQILNFLRDNETKNNPINKFIWVDQLNGLVLGLNIVYTMTCIILPFPISDLIGHEICNFADIFGCLYLAGSSVWSCTIAIYRILYLKATTFVNYGIGEKNLIVLLFSVGFFTVLVTSFFISFIDKGIGYRLCTHHSKQELEILNVNYLHYVIPLFKLHSLYSKLALSIPDHSDIRVIIIIRRKNF